MLELHIFGPARVGGEVVVSGAKNAALPILSASLLTDEPISLHHCPDITDVRTMLKLISPWKTAQLDPIDNRIELLPKSCQQNTVTKVASSIRASILLLGALIARHKRVILPLPGGCNLGHRGIDLHIEAMRRLGVKIILTDNELIAVRESECLMGAVISFRHKSVGATENTIMASCLADGETILENAASEPEIVNLAEMLNAMGANISGAGTDTITIQGVRELYGIDSFPIIGDRIEAGTYLIAAAITNGEVTVRHVNPEHLRETLSILRQAGAEIECADDWIYLRMDPRQRRKITVSTSPYPGLATDIQPLLLSLATQLPAGSTITETVFPSRFSLVAELTKMDATIVVENSQARIVESTVLSASTVNANNLRAGAALICAGLCANGITIIQNAEYIYHGYEKLCDKLQMLGINIALYKSPGSQSPACFRFFNDIEQRMQNNNRQECRLYS